jgi:hypothetical protein
MCYKNDYGWEQKMQDLRSVHKQAFLLKMMTAGDRETVDGGATYQQS